VLKKADAEQRSKKETSEKSLENTSIAGVAAQWTPSRNAERVWSEEEVGGFGSESQPASNQRLAVVPSITPPTMKCATAATLVLLALAASARDEKPCTVHDSEGTYYDLSGLTAK
jgi:hypothetical protein